MTLSESTARQALPDFRSREFLLGHAAGIMRFYHPRCIDAAGGFFHYFRDDGSIYDRGGRHLVSSTRFIYDYAMAWKAFGDPAYQQALQHGLDYLRHAHRNPQTGGYAWELRDGVVTDASQHCYGLAFVALAYAKAFHAGVAEAEDWLDETWELMEQRFWDADHGLYADEADADWNLSDYRGQNANMHACEAWLAAYAATGKPRYLARAKLLAEHMIQRQAALTGGLVWEHYRPDWSVDWDYNFNDRSNIFKPWGFQPGHQTEWAKLLLILESYAPEPWYLPKAQQLFDYALTQAWDHEHGGMVYGLDRDGAFYDTDKYYWVQAESLAAAAVLATRTGEERYWQAYQKLWQYSWQHLVDHRYGAWYRILSRDNQSYSDEKSPAGKTDYHTMGACYDVLAWIS